MTTIINGYKDRIAELVKENEANKNNPDFFESTPIYGMHDNGDSHYENNMAMIDYYKRLIAEEEEKAKKEAEKEKKIAFNAEKLGMTVEAYKAKKEKERAEKALKAKIKRYRAELEELNERTAYLEKWLAENEVE